MRTAIMAAVLVLTTQLGGCFFVFIPGSLIQRVSDSVTGAEGDNCVTTAATVGSRINLPDGRTATVKSLSGTSVRCTDARYPIRALLE